MILVDSSVWIDHLRARNGALVEALTARQVLMHPMVIGELACGNLQDRAEVIEFLLEIPVASVATDAEVLGLIETGRLMGKGIGWVDVHLLASTILGGDTLLWTRDRRLAAIADQFGLAYRER